MARHLYSFIFYLALPFILIRLCWRGIKAPAYRHRWQERFGFFIAPKLHAPLWIHAVSVGETIAAAALINRLLASHPDRRIVVTTMTPTGSERVKALFGDRVFHVYAPYDLPGAVNRFLDRVKPCAAIIIETELWPNLIHQCHQRKTPVLVANARLSERSARGYARVPGLTRQMLTRIQCIAAQNPLDGERFISLGLPRKQLQITGSIKFDIEIPPELPEQAEILRRSWGERPVWIAASTHEGEEEVLLECHRRLLESYPQLLLILVPRHPERFERVVQLSVRSGFPTARRSSPEPCTENTQVMVGDTMGELLLFYATADIAFVGGSLIERGGHNPLEPAALGKPLLCGPHFFNFDQITRLLQQKGALQVIESDASLVAQISRLLSNPNEYRDQSEAALQVVARNRGALARLHKEIDKLLTINPPA